MMEDRGGRWLENLSIELFKVFQSVTSDGDLVLSPMCIVSCLAMLLAGSENTTKERLRAAIGWDKSEAELFSNLQNMHVSLKHTYSQENASNPLVVAERIFIQKEIEVLEKFKILTQEIFKENEIISAVDFVDNATSTIEEINGWITKATENRIQKLVDSSSISQDTLILLTSAVAFKAAWKTEFTKSRFASFYGSNGKVVENVEFMHHLELIAPISGDDQSNFMLLRLPYTDERFALDVILPRDINDLPGLVETLSADDLGEAVKKFNVQKVEVVLPKFKLTTTLNLKDGFLKLGLREIFLEEQCDFSGITGKRDVHVSHILHSAALTVDEHGTEAAAATTAVLRKRRSVDDVIPFVADHPFLVILRHLPTHSILFIGRVNDVKSVGNKDEL